MGSVAKKNKMFSLFTPVRNVIMSSQGFPLFLAFTTLAVLFVLFRMKSVEIDYKVSALNKDIEKVSVDNKELKAQRAKHLSIPKLKKLAQKYNLAQPKQEQIIIVP